LSEVRNQSTINNKTKIFN